MTFVTPPAAAIHRASFIASRLIDDAPLSAALVCRRTRRLLVVRDHDGQQLAYVYFEDEPGVPQRGKVPDYATL